MISIEKEIEVRRFFKTKLSDREIAKIVEITQPTVGTIRKCSKLRIRLQPCRELKTLKRKRKCKTCGGQVIIWPCLLCHPEAGYYDELKPTWRN